MTDCATAFLADLVALLPDDTEVQQQTQPDGWVAISFPDPGPECAGGGTLLLPPELAARCP
ncbi:hypothetical protein ACFRQM_09290 [Streptomyces sp. NPDC056831]|uniref:hypothetical protein n=1 Tax=Streptomyces sp. NPDC056831 TaxID=3345954 RepID=UPI00369ADCA5